MTIPEVGPRVFQRPRNRSYTRGRGVAMGGKSPQSRKRLAVNELDIALCIASQQEQCGRFCRKFYVGNPSLSTTRLKDHCW